jgi:hypothetical protein
MAVVRLAQHDLHGSGGEHTLPPSAPLEESSRLEASGYLPSPSVRCRGARRFRRRRGPTGAPRQYGAKRGRGNPERNSAELAVVKRSRPRPLTEADERSSCRMIHCPRVQSVPRSDRANSLRSIKIPRPVGATKNPVRRWPSTARTVRVSLRCHRAENTHK